MSTTDELQEALNTCREAVGMEPGIAQRPMDIALEVQKRFAEACDRLYDMVLGDDGQAFSEAERFLKRHRPDLYNRLHVEDKLTPDLFEEKRNE